MSYDGTAWLEEADMREAINESLLSSVPQKRLETHLPIGLRNNGNTCFINCVVQVLFSMPEIKDLVINYKVDHRNNHPQPQIVMLIELRKLFGALTASTYSWIDPEHFLGSITDRGGEKFDRNLQHDTAEFFVLLLEKLKEAFRLTNNSRERGKHIDDYFKIKNKITLLSPKDEKSLSTQQEQELLTITIPILGYEDLMSSYKETLSHQVSYNYQSSNGSQEDTAIQKCQTIKFPRYLCFQLGRIEYDSIHKKLIKLDSRFEFDETILLRYPPQGDDLEEINLIQEKLKSLENYKDSEMSIETILKHAILLSQDSKDINAEKQIKKLLVTSTKEFSELENKIEEIKDRSSHKYSLKAVIVHEGKAEQGHYFVFIYDKIKNVWFRISDSNISQVQKNEVAETSFGGNGSTASAFVLFYENMDENENEDIRKGTSSSSSSSRISPSPSSPSSPTTTTTTLPEDLQNYVHQLDLQFEHNLNIAEKESKNIFVNQNIDRHFKKFLEYRTERNDFYRELFGASISEQTRQLIDDVSDYKAFLKVSEEIDPQHPETYELLRQKISHEGFNLDLKKQNTMSSAIKELEAIKVAMSTIAKVLDPHGSSFDYSTHASLLCNLAQSCDQKKVPKIFSSHPVWEAFGLVLVRLIGKVEVEQRKNPSKELQMMLGYPVGYLARLEVAISSSTRNNLKEIIEKWDSCGWLDALTTAYDTEPKKLNFSLTDEDSTLFFARYHNFKMK